MKQVLAVLENCQPYDIIFSLSQLMMNRKIATRLSHILPDISSQYTSKLPFFFRYHDRLLLNKCFEQKKTANAASSQSDYVSPRDYLNDGFL